MTVRSSPTRRCASNACSSVIGTGCFHHFGPMYFGSLIWTCQSMSIRVLPGARMKKGFNQAAVRQASASARRHEIRRRTSQIVAAQKQGLLPSVDPILFHYMMVSLTATLSGFGPEMQVTSGLSSEDPKVVAAYWRLVDEMVFGKEPKADRARKALKC